MFKTVGSYMPPPPPELKPPVDVGRPRTTSARCSPTAAPSWRSSATRSTFEHDSPRELVEYNERDARAGDDGQGGARAAGPLRGAARRSRRLYSDCNEADDGSFRAQAEYLLTVAPAARLARRAPRAPASRPARYSA